MSLLWRCRALRFLRRTHLALGLIGALYFTLIGVTGVALNHREGLRLEQHNVSRTWLPSSYRPQDGPEVRADIAVGDLHSGLIFGRAGAPILDVVAALWFLSLLSGLSLALLGRSVPNGARALNGKCIEARDLAPAPCTCAADLEMDGEPIIAVEALERK
jgi:hypothetical protein